MKEFSGWQALFLSFWSAQLYRDVAKHWQGTGYTYLFLVLCVTSIMYCVKLQLLANNIFDTIVYRILLQVPNVTCTHGEISIDRPSPYTVYSPGHRPFIVFDMNDQDFSAEPEMIGSEAMRVEKHGVWVKRLLPQTDAEGKNFRLQPLETGHDSNFVVTKQSVMTGGTILKSLFGAISFLVMVPIVFLKFVLITVLYSLAGYVTSRLLNLSLSFTTLIRLSSVCMTPVILVESIKRILNRDFPNHEFEIAAALVILGYMIFALYANRDTAVTLQPSESS
jgi:hypothetical protein